VNPDAPNTSDFPAGNLADLLDELGRRVPPSSCDEIWIFPPRRAGSAESTLLVLSALQPADRRRLVFTLQRVVRTLPGQNRPCVETTFARQGIAPADRLDRLVAGVLRRLGEPDAATPRHVRIGGREDRWQALLTASAAPS
jgi:hypothetical protein